MLSKCTDCESEIMSKVLEIELLGGRGFWVEGVFGWKKVRIPELSPHVRVEKNHTTKISHKPFFFLFFFSYL